MIERPSSTESKRALIWSVQDHHSIQLHASISRNGEGILQLGIRSHLNRTPLAKDSKVQEHSEQDSPGHLFPVSPSQMDDSEQYIFLVFFPLILSFSNTRTFLPCYFGTFEGAQVFSASFIFRILFSPSHLF